MSNGWIRRVFGGAMETTPVVPAGTGAGRPPSTELTDVEIDERINRINQRMRTRGEVTGISDVPVADADDDELERRINIAAQIISEGWEPRAIDSRIDKQLAGELRVLDYLIEHPNSSVPPLYTLQKSPELWDDLLAFRQPDAGGPRRPRSSRR